MRLPLTPKLQTSPRAVAKNVLQETRKQAKLTGKRPGLVVAISPTFGAGNGIGSFEGVLVSVVSSTLYVDGQVISGVTLSDFLHDFCQGTS